MAAATASTVPAPEERRFALYVLLGILAAMLLAAAAVGTRIYHQERDRLREEAAVAAQAAPGGEPKKDEAVSVSVGQFLRGIRDPLFLWTIVNSLLLGLGCIVYGSMYSGAEKEGEVSRVKPVPPLKLILVGVGGLLGFTTTLFLGIGYALYWWKELAEGGLAVWRETWTWLLVLAAFGGLVVTFLSLLAVKSEERTNPLLRRLLYGFNAFLVGFLLLAILVLVNGLFMIYGTTQTIDWTKAQYSTLSAPTKKVLGSVQKPIEAYLLLRGDGSLLEQDMDRLLENCKNYTNKLDVRTLYATSRRDSDKLADLLKRYEMLFQEGLLLVYDPNGENQHLFIKRVAEGADDLGLEDVEESAFPGAKAKSNFRGEQAVLHALNQFLSGKTRTTIYVTQDSGEFSLTDTPASRSGPQGKRRSLASLKTRLEKAGYKIEPWNLGAVDEQTRQQKQLPDDANIVLIAGANDSIARKTAPLVEYMKRPDSRLLIFTEPTRDQEGRVQPTGLEALLKPYGVAVNPDLVIHPRFQGTEDLSLTETLVMPALGGMPGMPLTMDPRLEQAFIATGAATRPAPFGESRTVTVGPVDAFEARPLLVTYPLLDPQGMLTGQWAESAPLPDVDAFIANLMKNRGELEAKLRTTRPVTVAASVADKGAQPQRPPHPGMPPPPAKPGKPRILVFGSTGPISLAGNERATMSYFFVTSALGWLRDRDVPPEAAAAVKPREFYNVNIPPEQSRSLVWLPLLFLLLLVILAGISVSLLRRR